MHESQPAPSNPTPETPSTAEADEVYVPDFDSLQEIGLKQLAKEAAKDRIYGEGGLDSWAVTNVVVPRSLAEAATSSRHTPEEQADEQVAIFEANVDYFAQKLIEAREHTASETNPLTQDEEEPLPAPSENIFSRVSKRVIQGLSTRFESLRERLNSQSPETDLETAYRVLGVTALTIDPLETPLPTSSTPTLAEEEPSTVATEAPLSSPNRNIFSKVSQRVIQGLSARFESLKERLRAPEVDNSEETEVTRRALGVTAFTSDQLSAEQEPSLSHGLATSWDDVFGELSTKYPPAIERDLKAAIARRFEGTGEIYYAGQGEYAIDPLNPPEMAKVLAVIRGNKELNITGIIDDHQPPIEQQTMSTDFFHTQSEAIKWQEKDREEARKKALLEQAEAQRLQEQEARQRDKAATSSIPQPTAPRKNQKALHPKKRRR